MMLIMPQWALELMELLWNFEIITDIITDIFAFLNNLIRKTVMFQHLQKPLNIDVCNRHYNWKVQVIVRNIDVITHKRI